MEGILFGLTLGNLGFNTLFDVRYRKISVLCCALFSPAAFFARLAISGFNLTELVLSLLPGVFLLLTVIISGGKVGMGDAIVFISLGFALPVTMIVPVMLAAMVLSALFSLGALILKKATLKSRIPFMPFVFLGFIIVYVMENLT